MTRPEGTKEELEARRKTAVKLLNRGFTNAEVADIFDVGTGSVSRWKQTYEEDGMEGLDAKPQKGGRPRELPKDNLPELADFLLEGAQAHGFETDLWTLDRIAEVIEEEFDVSVSSSTVSNYLQEMEWSNQRPQRRALERDEEAIEYFREERWKDLKKKLRRRTEP